MTLNFSKYHGCGNDFICVDLRDSQHDPRDLATQICRRGFSIGADGLVALVNSDTSHHRMLIVNADGSIPEMCGNGLRCFVAYLMHLGIDTNRDLMIQTDSGLLSTQIISDDGSLMMVNVDLGLVHVGDSLNSADFNLTDFKEPGSLFVNNQLFQFIPVSIGNPHAVIFVDDVDTIDLTLLGPQIEHHSFFPNRVNVEFIQVLSHSELKMRVWERGVGETNACGTGACASVVAGFIANRCSSKATVNLIGGQLKIEFNSRSSTIQMLGPAQHVFSSKINI